MKKIIFRDAGDTWLTYQMAAAMQDIGCDVFAITYKGIEKHPNAIDPCARYDIWAKFDDEVLTTDQIDAAISERLKRKE